MFNKKRWREEHKERIKEYRRRYWEKNKEKCKALSKKWRIEHQKELALYNKEYAENNRERRKENERKRRIRHPNRMKKYRKTLGGQIANKKCNAKSRQLGFIPLNQGFSEAISHHIDTERVVYIPAEMHTQNPHSILKNRGMDTINTLAFNWFEAEELYSTYTV